MENQNNVSNATLVELKQAFLSSAISDISTYIQLADTKVSIILGSLVALIAGIAACDEPILNAFQNLVPCSWLGVIVSILLIFNFLSVISAFIFGILTIRGHVSIIGYKSKWFLPQSCKEYSFDAFKHDVLAMTPNDIVENMAAELYKLNDINRQKAKTTKWVILSFSAILISATIIFMILLISSL